MARNRYAVQRRPAKRSSTWAFLSVPLVNVAADASVLLTQFNAAALALRPFTIVRTHLMLHVASDQQVADEHVRGALGLGVVSEDAAAAGAGSIPDPFADADFGWFVWQPFINEFLFITGSGIQEPAGSTYTVDSKAMRKVGLAETMVIMFEEAEGSAGLNVSLIGRMLLKLH